MTNYVIRLHLSKEQFRALVEQANANGQSLETVAAALIGDDLEKLAAQRERHRRATIDQLSREVGKPLPVDSALRQQVNQNLTRRLGGISEPPKRDGSGFDL